MIDDKEKPARPMRQRQAICASIRRKHKIEALELQFEEDLDEEFEDDYEDDDEEFYDENGKCYLCGQLEDDCFCFNSDARREFRDFVPYDD